MRFINWLRPILPGRLSRQLQIIAMLLLAAITALAAHQLWRTRLGLLAQTEQQMSRLDMVFAEQTGRAVETVDLVLHSIAEDARAGRMPGPAGAVGYDATLARRIAMVGQAIGVGVVDSAGRMVFASDPKLAQPVFPANVKAAIDRAIAHPESKLQISTPFRMPHEDVPRGDWTALMIRPVLQPDGADRFAAIAFLNLNYFADFYRAVELSEDGVILLHRRDGVVLARFPHDSAIIGKSYADLPPFKDILAHSMAGTLLMDSPIDGNRRVLAIRALKAFPLAVNVSVGEWQALRLWRGQALLFGLTSAVMGLMTLGLLLMLAGRSREREQFTHNLREAKEAAEAANARMAAEMEERERVEGALRKAQRSEAIGQITGGVAHDFNNLLSIVMGNLDLLERSLPPDDKTMGRLGTMRAAAERGATLTSQLLAFARRQPLLPRAVDLNLLVTGLRDLVQSAIGSRIKLQLRLQLELDPALIDPAQIELVILNLAINARDAMPQGGVLTIETGLEHVKTTPPADDLGPGTYVSLAVRDTGIGMNPDVAARAFEPFFTTKEIGRGSGLGLSQVYGIARQLGGGARIDSRRGEGTAVHVFLPRAGVIPVSGPIALPRRVPMVVRADAMVLVVDDDHAVRTTTASLLAELGYRVLEAGSGTDALDELENGDPVDILLTDVVMPGMTGPELARRARTLHPHLPVVFISGYSDPDALSGAEGFVHLVRKPARPDELVEKLELALSEAAASVG